MPVYHVSSAGTLAICTAKIKCRLGGPHGSQAEIEAALELEYSASAQSSKAYKLPESEPFSPELSEVEVEFWKEIRDELGLIIYKGMMFVPSDSESSQFYCYGCKARLPKSDRYKTISWSTTCTNCGESCDDGLVGVSLQQRDYELLDPKRVAQRDWYHYSSREEWESSMAGEEAPMVHLGSYEAAMDRRRMLKAEAGVEGKLYRVRLHEDSLVADKIIKEDPFDGEDGPAPADEGDYEGVALGGVTRYFNHYEDPGSISLLANPKKFASVAIEEF